MRAVSTTDREDWESNRHKRKRAYGMSNKEIAKATGLSHQNVTAYCKRGLRKLRQAWAAWSLVDFDESRRAEIERLLP